MNRQGGMLLLAVTVLASVAVNGRSPAPQVGDSGNPATLQEPAAVKKAKPLTASKAALLASLGLPSDPGLEKNGKVQARHDAGDAVDYEARGAADGVDDLTAAIRGAFGAGKEGSEPQLEIPEEKRAHARFVIAIVPDPVHTHLSLFFDRNVEAIQQGIQDSGYIFARANMPWDSSGSPRVSGFADWLSAKKYVEGREEVPGLMIFRKVPNDTRPDEADQSILVFVVGEDPTSGVNRTQFSVARQIMRRLGGDVPRRLYVLGPTFSGSLYPLKGLLDDQGPEPPVVRSGSISSLQAVCWFESATSQVDFQTFDVSDDYALRRFVQYVKQLGYEARQVAVLSEDETAYGNLRGTPEGDKAKDNGACREGNSPAESDAETRVLPIYFPREISQLRSAYQQNSSTKSQTSTVDNGTRPQTVLPLNLEDERSDDDTVPHYARLQTPLSQEAVLLAIVERLRDQDIRFVIIRASDPLDTLFLSKYLRTVYPQLRVVTFGADLLFARDKDDMTLRGTLALTPYALQPPVEDRVVNRAVQQPSRGQHIFPQTYAAGTFNATLSLMREMETSAQVPGPGNYAFAEYRWPGIAGTAEKGSELVAPLWLTVLGRGGYWPAAVLSADAYRPPHVAGTTQTDYPSMLKWEPDLNGDQSNELFSPHPRLLWILLCLACLMLAGAFVYAGGRGTILSGSDFMRRFAPLNDEHQEDVLLITGIICVVLLLTLAWPWLPWPGGPHFYYWWPGLVVEGVVLAAFVWIAFRALSRHDQGKAKMFVVASIVLYALFVAFCLRHKESVENLVLYRYVHVTSGVSPLVPCLFLIAAGLWWAWFTLAGLVFVSKRLPPLPKKGSMTLPAAGPLMESHGPQYAYIDLSSEHNKSVADVMLPGTRDMRVLLPTLVVLGLFVLGVVLLGLWLRISERVAMGGQGLTLVGGLGLSLGLLWLRKGKWRAWALPLAAAVFIAWARGASLGAESIEGARFDGAYAWLLGLAFFVLLSALLSLKAGWQDMRRLLNILDCLPLRRTFDYVKILSWGPLWNVQGDGTRLLARQLESLQGLENSLDTYGKEELAAAAVSARASLQEFMAGRESITRGGELALFAKLQRLQASLAHTCGRALVFLRSRWAEEAAPCVVLETTENNKRARLPLSEEKDIRAAEMFVCYTYLHFIVNLLERMRTLVLTVGGMYVLIMLSINSYPFEPRGILHSLMTLAFLIIFGFVVFIFAQMHRDSTLSRISNTTPGELGADFWLKLAAFGALPLLSLLSAQFPGIGSFLFSWVQPALGALK
jgi:hypothetical protein